MTRAREIGIRDLKDRLSEVLRAVAGGAAIVVTDRSRPVARIVAVRRDGAAEGLQAWVAAGGARWSGGKPAGLPESERPWAPGIADAVIEDRR